MCSLGMPFCGLCATFGARFHDLFVANGRPPVTNARPVRAPCYAA